MFGWSELNIVLPEIIVLCMASVYWLSTCF